MYRTTEDLVCYMQQQEDLKHSLSQQNGVYNSFICNFLSNVKVSYQVVSLLCSLSSDRTSHQVQRPGFDQFEGSNSASNEGVNQNGMRTWGFDMTIFFFSKQTNKQKVVSPVLTIWERRKTEEDWDMLRNFQDIQSVFRGILKSSSISLFLQQLSPLVLHNK